MDVLDTRFTIAICANTPEVRSRGVKLFERLFGACTVTERAGSWQCITEPSIEVEFWYSQTTDLSAIRKVERALRYAHLYQVAAEQVAIFLTITGPAGSKAVVVYANDWATAQAELFPIYNEGEYLCQWFESRQ